MAIMLQVAAAKRPSQHEARYMLFYSAGPANYAHVDLQRKLDVDANAAYHIKS